MARTSRLTYGYMQFIVRLVESDINELNEHISVQFSSVALRTPLVTEKKRNKTPDKNNNG